MVGPDTGRCGIERQRSLHLTVRIPGGHPRFVRRRTRVRALGGRADVAVGVLGVLGAATGGIEQGLPDLQFGVGVSVRPRGIEPPGQLLQSRSSRRALMGVSRTVVVARTAGVTAAASPAAVVW